MPGPGRPAYSTQSSATGWFVAIIVGLAMLSMGYLIFSANNGPSTAGPAAPARVSLDYFYVDPFTGCHYLSRGGITPRLGRDGKLICDALPTETDEPGALAMIKSRLQPGADVTSAKFVRYLGNAYPLLGASAVITRTDGRPELIFVPCGNESAFVVTTSELEQSEEPCP